MLKVLLTATVQSHICQFHKPLIEMLREHGDVEIHVAARNNLAEKNGLKLDFADKIYDIPFSRSPKSKDNIKAYKQLKKIINEENFDIIHCNTPMGGIVTRLAARKARKNGTKVYYTAHGFHFYKGASRLNWMVYYPIEKLFARWTDKLITINEEDYMLAEKKFKCKTERIHGVGVYAERYHAVTEEEQVEIRKELGLSLNKRYIICVGELLPNKNQKMVIEAMSDVVKEYRDVELLLAGNGPEKDNLSSFVCSLNLQNNVKFLGYVTNLEKYQQVSEIAVSCSKREGLGLNLIEAMLVGNPVIGTKNRGHNELITEGVNGYLVEIGDADSLRGSIISLLKGTNIESIKVNAVECGRRYVADKVKEELYHIYSL